jgi:hypothetical protein
MRCFPHNAVQPSSRHCGCAIIAGSTAAADEPMTTEKIEKVPDFAATKFTVGAT